MKHLSISKALTILTVICLGILLVLPTIMPEKFANTSLKDVKINLGLDLKGGSSLLLEVDTEQYNLDQMQITIEDLAVKLKKEGVRLKDISIEGYKRINFSFYESLANDKKIFNRVLSDYFGIFFKLQLNDTKGYALISDDYFNNLQKNLLEQTLEIMRRRTDESGLKEIEIQKQGSKGVLLQVPGLENPEMIKNLIGKTAKLTFHLVSNNYTVDDILRGRVPKRYKVLSNTDKSGGYVVIERKASLSGEMLVDARATIIESVPMVTVSFNTLGAKKFATLTGENVGAQLAIVLDDTVISAPVIQDHILAGKSTIRGNFTTDTANELAMLLRAGALPAPLNILEERTVGPSLGQDSIEAGSKSMALAVIFIILTILFLYRVLGLFVILGLMLNLLMILALLAVSGASLTLSGIAGIILTLGIAVDANVLIIERIKEEYKKHQQVLKAIINGFDSSFMTIFDANLTTIFTAVILLLFGTGYVKGFAITLIFGIGSSMFSAIFFTKFITEMWYKFARPKELKI